jgi:hypothetical protein
VRSIARSLGVYVATTSRANRAGTRAAAGRAPGGFQSGQATRASVPQAQGRRGSVTASTQAQRNAAPTSASRNTASASVAGPVARASNGRFMKKQGKVGSLSMDYENEKTARPSAIGRLSDAVGRLSGALVSAENVDPTINAAKELTGVVSPLGRGLFDTVVSGMEVAWKGMADGFKGALDGFMQFPAKIGEFFAGLDESMRNLPIIGKAYAAAADGIRSAGAAARSGFTEGQDGKTSAAPTSAAQAIGRDVGKAVTAVKDVGAQAKAGYDARGRATDAPTPTGIVQSIARKVGGAVGRAAQAGSNAMTMLQAGREAGMGTKELANFMGQNAHESGGFRNLSENLNYSAQGLRKTFGKYYRDRC